MTTILFESPNAAADAAYMLKGEWDGFNGVIVEQVDIEAIKFVANQVRSNYCIAEAGCFLPITTEMILSLYANGLRDFQKVDLSFINLSGANLVGINLNNAILYHANFEGANLADANFESASLANANLKKANLKNANLQSANLDNANFLQANLRKANLINVYFEEIIPFDLNLILLKILFYRLFKHPENIKEMVYFLEPLNIITLVCILIVAFIYLPLVSLVQVLVIVVKGILACCLTSIIITCSTLLVDINLKLSFSYGLTSSTIKPFIYFNFSSMLFLIVAQIANALRENGQMFASIIFSILAVIGLGLSVLKIYRALVLFK